MNTRDIAEELWYLAARRLPYGWDTARAYPVLHVNPFTKALIARVCHQEACRGSIWRGLSLTPCEVRRLARVLRNLRLTTKGQTAVGCLAEKILQITRAGTVGLVIVGNDSDRRRRERTIAHEMFHQFQYQHPFDHRTLWQLFRHPITDKARPHMRRSYDVTRPAIVVHEMAAYIVAKDHRSVGLTPQESRQWFATYVSGFAAERRKTMPFTP